jgi:signal transduction histidine kinase
MPPTSVDVDRIQSGSSDRLKRLVSIAIAPSDVFKHDVGNRLGAVFGFMFSANDIISRLLPHPEFSEELTNLSTLIRDLNDELAKLVRLLNMWQIDRNRKDSVEAFQTMPKEVITAIREQFSSAVIEIDESSIPATGVLFPENVSFALLNELVANAIEHGSARIRLSWAHTEQHILVTVADSGPGICAGLMNTYAPLDLISPPEERRKQLGGLRLVQQLLTYCSGALLFRRSPELGGTEAYLRVPHFGSERV